MVHDPLAATRRRRTHEYGVELTQLDEYTNLDGLIFAVCHKEYIEIGPRSSSACSATAACFIDVKSVFDARQDGARHPVLEPVARTVTNV